MRTSWSITGSGVLLVLLVLSWVGSAAQRGAPPQNVEDAFKNIKVLTGTPADQLFLTMQFFEASLGWAASSVTAVLVTWTRHANQKLANGRHGPRDQQRALQWRPSGHVLHVSPRQRTATWNTVAGLCQFFGVDS